MTQAGAAGMRPDGGPRAREGAADAEGSAKCTADCPPDCTGAIVACIPALRVFARSLCRDVVEADDLVQETLVRAIEKLHLFEPGTNLRAWLFTIMRNRFYSNWTRRARERPGEKDCASTVPVAPPDSQIWHIRGRELERALLQLPVHYRETIMLVTVLGESYRQAAEVLGCDIGTIKSRVNRARAALREALGDAGGT
jgi:RNA polymerase sigma-70 factor (ECF subfamily)